MAEIKLKAFPVSEKEQKKLKAKFPAYSNAALSERAEKEGTYKNSVYLYFAGETGLYFTRSRADISSSFVQCVDSTGSLIDKIGDFTHCGLRVALQIIYNREQPVVKSCRTEKRTAMICNDDTNIVEMRINEAPIVVFGKKEYIWLNKEDCENDSAKTMELISVKLLAKSVQFDKAGENNDFANAVELQKQCYEVATENCTEEEIAMLAPVVMNDEDNYNNATPILGTEKKTTTSSTKDADNSKGGK